MTLIVSWIGVDTHGISSLYFAGDSRISWEKGIVFDHGRKVFGMRNHPDVLAYCGDVLFPSMALGQIAEMADNGLLFPKGANCSDKFKAIKTELKRLFQVYPNSVSNITNEAVQILHGSRDPTDIRLFKCSSLEWRRGQGWTDYPIELPKVSGVLKVYGSGSQEFNDNYDRFQSGPNQDTSRNVFHCFCDTLFNIRDQRCGGAPQLVGVNRRPNSGANTFGVIRAGRRYFLGAETGAIEEYGTVEWRNDDFEICDGNSMLRKDRAQRQPNFLRRK